MLASAAHHHRGGQPQAAARLYRRILDLDPHQADALHLLGVVALQSGRLHEAVELITRAIAENGTVPAFYNNLGSAFLALGQRQEAADAFQRALSLTPNSPDTLYNLAVAFQQLGRLEEAAASYEQVLRAKPEHAAAHTNLGIVRNMQGRSDDALACFEGALRSRADFLPAVVNRGNMLKALGRIEDAVQSYRRALALDPRYAAAHNNLGLALLEAGRLDEAITSYKSALSIEPRYREAHRNLGNALRERGGCAESQASYRQALSLDPNDAEARLGLAMASIPVFVDSPAQSDDTTRAFEQALAELAAWDAESPGRLGSAVGSTQPFYLAYRPFDIVGPLTRYGDVVCRAAAAYWRTSAGHRAAGSLAVGQAAADRIRMVVVCGHVRARHPVWDVLLRGILAHLQRERLEIFLYHTGSFVDDETLWARSRVDRFVQGPKSVAAWAEEMQRDQPDIIFYPEVGMDPVTCALAAIRLASLQVASWGHPVTTGLPSIDLYISGELLEIPRADAHYVEKLVRLPGTGVCTRAPVDSVQTWEPAANRGEAVRFALPHQPIKFDPADDILLARIAKAIGRCEFWIASPAKLGWAAEKLRARLAEVFRAEGLDPQSHLRMTPWLPPEQFLGFLDCMDVFLDCPAFSGYTTAWQALHRGLPLVTLEGEFLRQRLAAGLMRQIGAGDSIALSRDHYVTLAVQSAEESRNSERRAATRRIIQQAAAKADEDVAAIGALQRVLTRYAEDFAGSARISTARIPDVSMQPQK